MSVCIWQYSIVFAYTLVLAKTEWLGWLDNFTIPGNSDHPVSGPGRTFEMQPALFVTTPNQPTSSSSLGIWMKRSIAFHTYNDGSKLQRSNVLEKGENKIILLFLDKDRLMEQIQEASTRGFQCEWLIHYFCISCHHHYRQYERKYGILIIPILPSLPIHECMRKRYCTAICRPTKHQCCENFLPRRFIKLVNKWMLATFWCLHSSIKNKVVSVVRYNRVGQASKKMLIPLISVFL